MLLLLLVIGTAWCVNTGRTNLHAWKLPINYWGDSLFYLTEAKAYQEGEISPLGWKHVAALGAPSGADWNHRPQSEDLLPAMIGWLGRGMGLYVAANVVILLSHLLAGISMWCAGRLVGYRRLPLCGIAILFGCSPFLFSRGLNHLVLTWCWYLPLAIVVSWWSLKPKLYRLHIGTQRWWIATATSVVVGLFNPYYLNIYLQFLGFAVLFHVLRKNWRQVAVPLMQSAVAVLGFLIMQLDWLTYGLAHGFNFGAVVRQLKSLESCSLEIPALYLPRWHRLEVIDRFSNAHFHTQKMVFGETGANSNYLGWAATLGLALLLGILVVEVLKGRIRKVPAASWQALWVIAYAVTGGGNLVLGAWGFLLFRCGNRYSIVLMVLALLFLARTVSRWDSRSLQVAATALLVVGGLYDQLPAPGHRTVDSLPVVEEKVENDGYVVARLEGALKPGAAVFQLPATVFPEAGITYKMEDYSHFRLYINSSRLIFSYGTHKQSAAPKEGRMTDLAPEELKVELERRGFSALVINKDGYKDGGRNLIRALGEESTKRFERGEYAIFFLEPGGSKERGPQ